MYGSCLQDYYTNMYTATNNFVTIEIRHAEFHTLPLKYITRSLHHIRVNRFKTARIQRQ